MLQGRWQHGEEVGYWYPSGLAKTICKWDIKVPLVTKGLYRQIFSILSKKNGLIHHPVIHALFKTARMTDSVIS